MNSRRHHEELARKTSAELARLEDLTADLNQRAGGTPSPGDLYLLDAGLHEAIEWVVLECSGDRSFVVPADSVPLVGSADVAVPAAQPCGPLSLRCGSGLWLDGHPDATERTGVLAPGDLARAVDRRHAVAAGDAGSVAEREVDDEPDYREWLEVVGQVRAAVAAGMGSEDDHAGAAASLSSQRPAARRQLPAGLLALAAALLLVTTLALWTRGVRLGEQLDELTQVALAAKTNLPVAWLIGDLRSGGQSTKVTLAADSAWLMLILRAPDGDVAGARYRLEVRREGSDESLWNQDGLHDLGSGEITLAVPRHLLTGGLYELLLRRADGERQNSERPARVYSLEIEVESGPVE